MSLGDGLFDEWCSQGVKPTQAGAMLDVADDDTKRALERIIYMNKYYTQLGYRERETEGPVIDAVAPGGLDSQL